VVVLVLGIGSSSRRAAGNARTASGATAVQRRDLVETDTESGTLSYARARTVYDGLSGTITWLPSSGQVIRPGQTLFKVNGQPVIMMNGATPAYRDLTPFDGAGQDILELNRDLVAFGFNPDEIIVNDTWQAATTAGVDAFQASLARSRPAACC
jgi:membrane fusion protein, multidrug efflux system